jgi:hypothetical protein
MRRHKGQTLLGLLFSGTLMGILLFGAVQIFITMNRTLADFRDVRTYYHQILILEGILSQVWIDSELSTLSKLPSGGYKLKGDQKHQSWEFSLRPAIDSDSTSKVNLVVKQTFPDNQSKVSVVLDGLQSGPRTMILVDAWKMQFQAEGSGGQYLTLFQYQRPEFLDGISLTRIS